MDIQFYEQACRLSTQPRCYSLMKSAFSVHVLLMTSLSDVESGSTQKKPSLSSWNLSTETTRQLSARQCFE